MKYKRHNRIIEIIGAYNIETQDELIERLKDSGFDVTQATISRDIKQLGLVKASTKDNRYKYALPTVSEQENMRITAKYRNIIRETIIKIDFAENIVVLKTYSGMAQAAAASIDGMNWDEMVGSIAGDDTVLVVMRDTEKARDITGRFRDIISGDTTRES